MTDKYQSYGEDALREMDEMDEKNRKTLKEMEIEQLEKRILSVKKRLHELQDKVNRMKYEQKEMEKRKKHG